MPRRKTSSSDSKLKQGRGQGHGEDYQPFLTVRDVPSQGLSHRVKGYKSNRVHHLLSNLEKGYFLLLEWSSDVVEIREQYPLPLEQTLAIAERLGLKHPAHPKTKEPTVMTTDFRIDVLDVTGTSLHARSIKSSQDLGNKRTIEKLEIERTYWSERKVPWGLVTERDIPRALVDNIEWIYSAAASDDGPNLPADIFPHVEASLFDQISENLQQPLSHAAMAVDSRLGLAAGTGLWVVRHLIASRQWKVDMTTAIEPDKPLAIARIASSSQQEGRA